MGGSSTNRYIAGRVVSPSGTVAAEFRISTGYGKASDVAFDAPTSFVVWCEDYADTEIRGRFVSPAGVPGTEISVNASAAPSDNPKSVTFDGSNYLVSGTTRSAGLKPERGTCSASGSARRRVGRELHHHHQRSRPPTWNERGVRRHYFFATWMDMSSVTNWDV